MRYRQQSTLVQQILRQRETLGKVLIDIRFAHRLQLVSFEIGQVRLQITVAQISNFEQGTKKLDALLYYYLAVASVEQTLVAFFRVILCILLDCPLQYQADHIHNLLLIKQVAEKDSIDLIFPFVCYLA